MLKKILGLLINKGANPFLTDNNGQSAIQILATSYFLKPIKYLKDKVELDFRQKDENGFDFCKKIEKELIYHQTFFRTDKNNFREIVEEFIDPFYKVIENKVCLSMFPDKALFP